MASWAQYWFDAQQKARRPRLFYGGDARVVSPLVYFICHHVNKVLELPVRLRHVLENLGWQRERDYLEEHDVGTLVDGLEREMCGGGLRRPAERVDIDRCRSHGVGQLRSAPGSDPGGTSTP